MVEYAAHSDADECVDTLTLTPNVSAVTVAYLLPTPAQSSASDFTLFFFFFFLVSLLPVLRPAAA